MELRVVLELEGHDDATVPVDPAAPAAELAPAASAAFGEAYPPEALTFSRGGVPLAGDDPLEGHGIHGTGERVQVAVRPAHAARAALAAQGLRGTRAEALRAVAAEDAAALRWIFAAALLRRDEAAEVVEAAAEAGRLGMLDGMGVPEGAVEAAYLKAMSEVGLQEPRCARLLEAGVDLQAVVVPPEDTLLACIGKWPELAYEAAVPLKALLAGGRRVREAALATPLPSWLLRLAPEALRGDREVVLHAVAHDRRALEHAAAPLRNNRGVVLAAIAHNGRALEQASEALRGDKAVVLAAVQEDGMALFYASDALRGDEDVVRAAVAQNDYCLKYASDPLQALLRKRPVEEPRAPPAAAKRRRKAV